MSIQPRNRAWGYTKGMASVDLHLEIRPEEHYISTDTGRPTIPTKTVDLEFLKKFRDTFARPIHMSDIVPMGQVVIVDHGALPYHHGAYLHPTDYYWVRHKERPEVAHNLVMSWIDQRIESMGKAAEARLDAMVEEFEYKAAQKAAYDRYREQIKYYHDMGSAFLSLDEIGSWSNIVAEGERIHRVAEEEQLSQEHEDDKIDVAYSIYGHPIIDNGAKIMGYSDDWSQYFPRISRAGIIDL